MLITKFLNYKLNNINIIGNTTYRGNRSFGANIVSNNCNDSYYCRNKR
jgi:hypothetical protein